MTVEEIEKRIALLTPFCISRFKDKNLKYPKKHYYVYVPCIVKDHFFLCMLTTQGEKLKAHYARINKINAINSLININKDQYKFLKEVTVINCNNIKIFTKKSLLKDIDEDNGLILKNIIITDIKLKKDIILGIKNSPLNNIENIKDFLPQDIS
jgi:hypothetical protein